MYLRCSKCHAPTWIRSLVPGTVDTTVACGECHHEHDLSRAQELGLDNKSQHAAAQAFADRHGVDLPTAYSVLLGLIDLEAAREHDASQRKEARKATAPVIRSSEAPPPPVPAPRLKRRRQEHLGDLARPHYPCLGLRLGHDCRRQMDDLPKNGHGPY